MTSSAESAPQHKNNRSESKKRLSNANLGVEQVMGENAQEFTPIVSSDKSSVSVLLEGNGSDEAREAYTSLINSIPTKAHREIAVDALEVSYQQAHELDPEFRRPATVKRTSKGDFVWSAGTEEGTTGLAIVWPDGGLRLGEEKTSDVVDGLIENAKIVIADNALLNSLQDEDPQKDRLNLAGIENASGDGETYHRHGVVFVEDNAGATVTATVAARKIKRSAEKAAVAVSPGEEHGLSSSSVTGNLDKSKPGKELELYAGGPLDDDEAKEAFIKEHGFFITDKRGVSTHSSASSEATPSKELELYRGDKVDGASIPGKELELYRDDHADDAKTEQLPTTVMDMVRVAGNVERHSDKVAKYEAIAATALAKRMKGKLFKSLRRKSQEADEDFDHNMRMLDRFTMALDNSLMQQWTLEGKSDEEAAQMLYEHQKARAEVRSEQNRNEFTKGKVASWLDRYANLPTKKKVAYSLGAGAVIAVAGVGLAAAGGVAAAAGGVGLAAVKVGKTYAQQRSKLYTQDSGLQPPLPNAYVVDSNGDTSKHSAREQIIIAKEHTQSTREKSIKDADRNKKIAVGLASIAAILVGSGVATKMVEHSDDIRGFFSDSGRPERDGGTITVPEVERGDEGSSPPEQEGRPDVPEPDPTPTPDPLERGLGGGDWQRGGVGEYFNGTAGTAEFSASGVDNFNQWVDNYTVQAGDSIWSLSEDYLRDQGITNPNVYQIDAVKDAILHDYQSRGLVDANGWLSAGDRMNLR